MDKATEDRAKRKYDYSNPPSDPRYDLLNWPYVKIGDLPPQRGAELDEGGNVSYQLYTNTLAYWLNKHPDPIVPIEPELVTYDYVDAIRVMAEQMNTLVQSVAEIKAELLAMPKATIS